MNRFLRCVPIVTLMLMVYFISIEVNAEGESQALPPLPQIPGITAPDQFPRACVDCHVNRTDLNMDVRLSTIVRKWQEDVDSTLLAKIRPFVPANMALKGKHPAFQVEVADVPQTCLECHAQNPKSAPPLGPLLHGLHLTGGEKNHFVTIFQGECTHCHKLNAETGVWSLGSGREKE